MKETPRPIAVPVTAPALLTLGLSLGMVLALASGEVSASELVLSRAALQSLVNASLFQDHGKWFFDKGLCYAFLEKPQLTLAQGRVVIAAHFAAREGVVVTGSCVGADLSSPVTLSGQLVGAGSQMTLRDIRLNKVNDELSRNAIELLQSTTGTLLPKSQTLDVLPLLQPATIPDTGIRVEVSALRIAQVVTRSDSVLVTFDASLIAR